MIVTYHKNFKKSFQKRILPYPELTNKFYDRLDLFLENPKSQELKNHKLVGNLKGLRSFSVTGDIRTIYLLNKNEVLLMDIGSHAQVY